MAESETTTPDESHRKSHRRPHILVGVTNPQTCLVLKGRLRALREAGFRVSLLSAPGQLLYDTARSEQVAAYAVPMERGIAPIADIIALFHIWRLLRHLRPDIVEFSTPKAGLLGSLAARICRIPSRVYFLRGLKLETALGLKRILLLITERVASASASVVVCNSRSLRNEALALRIASASKLVLLGKGSSNGVDLERFRPGISRIRQQLGIPDDVPVVGFSGRLTHDKGLPELLEAFAAILREEPNTRLLLVGWFDAAEDALGIGLRARIEGHPQIICTGFVADTAPYYRAMDLMVLPTLREGFPNVVLEAAATGIAVIGTLCTGSRDAVVPEVTGMLVPPGHPAAISEAVLRLLRNRGRCLEMGNAARAWVVENYENKRVLGLTVDFYQKTVAPDGAEQLESAAKLGRRATGLPVLP
jgi:glycosyltransferase involved in cell wall biosynthesis